MALVAKKLRAEPALSLALLRVVVALMFLLAPGFAAGVQVAAWDPARFVVPEGLHWFVAVVPIRIDFARVAQGAVLFFAVLGALGVYSRAAFAGLTLSGFYLFAIAQLTGFVWHDMHLLWFSAVLAVSPCGDVLAFDAEFPWDHEHERYALPPIGRAFAVRRDLLLSWFSQTVRLRHGVGLVGQSAEPAVLEVAAAWRSARPSDRSNPLCAASWGRFRDRV